MTGMEHTIEKAARDEANRRHAAAERSLNKSRYGEGSDYYANDGARDGFVDGAEWAVEHLRAQGLLAPAPLREVQAEAWAECSQWHAEQGMPVNGAATEHNPYRQEATR